MKNKKGISLIVLVITIIVLAILAATVIIAIVNTGVINSAKDAVEAQKLGQVRDIATVAWGQALINPNVSTPAEYLNHIIDFLKGEGYTDEELDKYTIVANVNGVTVNLKDTNTNNPEVDPDVPEVDPDTPEVDPDVPEVNPDTPGDVEYAGLTITKDTEGVTFTKADGVTPGDPDNLETGDIVIYGDYEYRYNESFMVNSWTTDTSMNGWGVKLNAESFEKTTVGELCGNIYGKPLLSMDNTFSMAVLVTNTAMMSEPGGPESPEGPIESVEEVIGASIQTAPQIPSSVISMVGTFYGCSSLIEAPVIPREVTDISTIFSLCTSLTNATVIPEKVIYMRAAFSDCTSLTGIIMIKSPNVFFEDSNVATGSYCCLQSINNSLTVNVPANSDTYSSFIKEYGDSRNIIIETFEP